MWQMQHKMAYARQTTCRHKLSNNLVGKSHSIISGTVTEALNFCVPSHKDFMNNKQKS